MSYKIKIKSFDKDEEFLFVKANYVNNKNLSVQILYKDDELGWDDWGVLTVNLCDRLPDNQAYLDINNCSPEIINWVLDNHAKIIGQKQSGFCLYPLVEFSEKFLSEMIVPEELQKLLKEGSYESD